MPSASGLRRAARLLRGTFYRRLSDAVRILVRKGDRNACLVIKIDALGDLFVWFSSGIADVAAEARAAGRHTVLVARPELVKFLEEQGLFDEVWPLDTGRFRRDLGYRLQMLADFRRFGFSRILQLRHSRESLQEDAIVRAIGAQQAQSPVGDRHNMSDAEARSGDRLYTPLLQSPAGHELDRNRAATTALTGKPATRFSMRLTTPLPEAITSPYWVIAPGAGWDKRKWPAGHFAEVAGQFPGHQCVVVGTRDDVAEGDAIAQAAGGISLCGTLSLSQLPAVISRASLVLANESGLSHMAAYFGVPSVAILGGGHYGWFMPYPESVPELAAPVCAVHPMPCFGCNWQCIYPLSPERPVPCIENVSLEAVQAAISTAMAGYTPKR